MGAFQDKTGMQYGYATVIKKGESKGGRVYWVCQCRCGNIFERRTDILNDNSMCSECDALYRKGALLSATGKLHPAIKDERGNKYGKLTVIDVDKEKTIANGGICWKCKCDCGNEKTVSGSDLRGGKVTSCGCNHVKEELPGTVFGKLTVLKRIENSKAGKARYLCRCECGNTCEVVGYDLRSGQQISCGCLKSKGEYAIIKLLQENNIDFEKEAVFETCVDTKVLPFDFKISHNGKTYLVEFDGKQHFSDKHAWDTFSFERTQKHDAIKNKWAAENGYPLIRIPYTHLKDLCIEDLLLDKSSFIVNRREE